MEKSIKCNGWQIHHQERLIYRANAGIPNIRLRFFNYASYRQIVQIDKAPSQCKLKAKGNNSYFLFQHKSQTKGVISLDRIITVIPIPSFTNPKDDWGKISNFPKELRQKYKQSSRYWSVKSTSIGNISKQDWFKTDDLSSWVKLAFDYITAKIKHREKQERRLGADQAFITGTGDCDEFTDLFVTFARMRGIPCRRLTGYFITKKGISVEAHAWGEIFSLNKGWIPIDIALNNIGYHTSNYVILKIEEFNPALSDYHVQTGRSGVVHYHWERPDPIVTPVYYDKS